MEKLMYPLWRKPAEPAEALRERLLGPVGDALFAAGGVRHLRLGIVDAEVAPAAALRQEHSKPPIDAILSLWVDSSVWRERYERLFSGEVARFTGYLVTESEPIVPAGRARADGSRVEGMSQVVFLQRPPRLAFEDWIRIWHGSHTQVAIDTQSTFGYRQNVIVRALTYAAPHYDAIIEENFPAAAMSSPQAFYAAVGDEAKYQANLQAMIDSCRRFIDFDRIDVIPTSEYNRSAC
jgi:hypothetical protein